MIPTELGATPDGEPASKVEMAWVNLAPEYTEDIKTRALEQGVNVDPVEGIVIWGENREKLNMRQLLLELGQHHVMVRREVEPIRISASPDLASQRVRLLFPLATDLENAYRTKEGISQLGGLFAFARVDVATPLQYARARFSLLTQTNNMLVSVGKPPFPAFTLPTTREIMHLAPKI